MNNELTAEQQAWADGAGRALRASENSIDALAAARLRAARARALEAVAEPRAPRWMLAAPAALTAALLAWALLPRMALTPDHAPAVNLAGADALELMTDEHGPEFYENLDLYLWLEDSGERGDSA